jgi:protoheme IX farnesyltransferase
MAATLMLTVGGYTGYSTLAVATVLGLSWLYLARWGYKAADERLWGKKLFIFSILTIFILSVMMSIDFTAPVPSAMLLSEGSGGGAVVIAPEHRLPAAPGRRPPEG